LSALAGVLALDAIFFSRLRQRVNRVLAGLDEAAKDLQLLSVLMRRLEHETFEVPLLKEISAALLIAGQPASERVAAFGRWIALVDSSDHVLVRTLRPLLLWREQCAFAIDRWRVRNASHVAGWLASVGDFEALSSFASLSYERPSWCFPNLGGKGFVAIGLEHPLLTTGECVPNDVALQGELRLLIISGSNMSGKSTLLRAIGVATVLAWAGAPVPARSLTLSPLEVGAAIRVTDSLQDNRSRFFAEITRLRQIVDLSKRGVPALFLLDELLSGTNSHDRRMGAAAVVKGLVASGAIGLITTHDLALAEIERDLGQQAANAHFEDQIVDGRIDFDYKLRPGVVTHSNALELMRAVGLSV
jgi:DNA mismatch repair ATPase MutS